MANENFDFKKFVVGLNLLDPVAWSKAASHSLRITILVGLIALGWGYYKGYKGRPIQVDAADAKFDLVNGDGKHHLLEIKHGAMTFDGKTVSTKDVPRLHAFGVELAPKLVTGVTSAGNPAIGVGLGVAHLYNLNLDGILTYPFVGIGLSYALHIDKPIPIQNTSVGIAVGRDIEASENGLMAYLAVDF